MSAGIREATLVRINNILVPTDFSENAQLAFDHAYALAAQLDAKLYLLHVRDESALRIAVKEGLLGADTTDEELQTAVEQLVEERLSATLAGVDRTAVTIEKVFRRGDPKLVIIEYAREIDADVIVVGMRGTGVVDVIKTALLGSVAESVIRKARCPVLMVRLDHGEEDDE
ncbi:MAG TPA: universal stress protein [Blastocatellia bacterium]|nr:universal stress protein [Blastocatellia bacterium]